MDGCATHRRARGAVLIDPRQLEIDLVADTLAVPAATVPEKHDDEPLAARVDALAKTVLLLQEELASGACRPRARLGDELQIHFLDNGLSRRFRLVEKEDAERVGDQGPHRQLHGSFIEQPVGYRTTLTIARSERVAELVAIYREIAGTWIRISAQAPEA